MPGLPQHDITLKTGVPVMVLRNICPPGIVNGTICVVRVISANVLQLQVITGPSRGDDFYLPRVPIITQAASGTGFRMQRLQFSIHAAFAMTINNCQGQTKSYVGVYLPTPRAGQYLNTFVFKYVFNPYGRCPNRHRLALSSISTVEDHLQGCAPHDGQCPSPTISVVLTPCLKQPALSDCGSLVSNHLNPALHASPY
ncbi:hypothetical protein GWK47_045598 [Chionoecetes opilio]|uniref:DNA helicase Pif1-like 2B domain-containing protein n=1 Tax=Chionoecetes opilio TaxID=41210 RepID=A0A8J4YI85_CHIOP|nr:hypothetical protein GWK47_045598 [Chionoecetes opilio]